MSEHHDDEQKFVPQYGEEPNWMRFKSLALLVGAIGFGAYAVIGILNAALGTSGVRQYFASYLTAFILWFCVPIGCMVLQMINYLTAGRWGYILRRVFEANIRMFPFMALAFIPVGVSFFIGEASPYWWAKPSLETQVSPGWGQEEAIQELQHKQSDFLNPPFAIARAVVYLSIWGALAFFLNRWSRESDKLQNTSLRERFKALSGPGLMLHALVMTLAATDWLMSLEPSWASTMFPVIFAVTQILVGYAFSVVVAIQMAKKTMVNEVSNLDQINLGSFLLAFTLFWTYISFSQFMLVWAGNLPEEIPFYLKRSSGGWQYVMSTLFVLHFFAPFMLLLYRDVKTNRKYLTYTAIGLIAVCALDVVIWVQPTFNRLGQPFFGLMDIAAIVGLGGLYVFLFIGQYQHNWKLPAYEDHLYHREHAHHG